MQLLDGELTLSASDLTGFLACNHLSGLSLATARGQLTRPDKEDPELDVITCRGIAHEFAYLDSLQKQGLEVVTISDVVDLNTRVELTRTAMGSGAQVIYQATFLDGHWLGHADFLVRVERPTKLGAWGYEVQDTKLARRVKAAALLQMCLYSELLGKEQGADPELIHVVLGDMRIESFGLDSIAAYYRTVKRRLEAYVADPPQTYPDPVEHCAICRWADVCDAKRRADDHLCLVAGCGRSQARKLATAGVDTVRDLAESTGDLIVGRMGPATVARLRDQAVIQIRGRETESVCYELLEPEGPGRGLAILPEPSPGDLFFDIEGDPFVESEGLEYLLGVVDVADGEPVYRALWSHSRTEEKAGFEAFMDLLTERLAAHPEMHIYHYASYEQTAIKRLMGRHGTREDEVDRLLRGGVLVDLYQVVRQGVRVSQESYSLKEVEPLYMSKRRGAITDAGSSIVAYERWLESDDEKILEDLVRYNEDDCVSTWKLRDWLETLRAEAAERFDVVIERPLPMDPEASPEQAKADAETSALVEELTADVPDEIDARTEEEQARWLLAQLLGWHRREDKPAWWAYYHRLTLSDEELVQDPESIGELEYDGEAGRVDRSILHRYRFDPAQEYKISVGKRPIDPQTRKPAGLLEELDDREGRLVLKRGATSSVPHPRSLIPPTPIGTQALRSGLARVARSVIANGLEQPGPYAGVCELILRLPPEIHGERGAPIRHPDEPLLDAARRVALELEGCLPVQGPPGSGKTYAGARMIAELVRTGKRIAVCATSHRAICNLLEATVTACEEGGVPVRILQKADEGDSSTAAGIDAVDTNDEVEAAIGANEVDVVGGTPWLFAREEFVGEFDHLFVDEAGQMSLANVVAIGSCAQRIVLLGDPRQLAHPGQGTHPPGAGVSALEHLLGDAITVPPERGLFLDTTWRLSPSLCDYISEVFYERRLVGEPSCSVQNLVVSSGDMNGLRVVAVDHAGNRVASMEEAHAVAELFAEVIGASWTGRDGTTRRIGLEDILVVAPYNAHVARLRSHLPEGSRVGTVDRFQGQEAPVVIFSMATSSPDELLRAMEFLYSLNRLNVAISRAQGLAIIVQSPKLVEVVCRSPRQMQLANALCRFVELASAERVP